MPALAALCHLGALSTVEVGSQRPRWPQRYSQLAVVWGQGWQKTVPDTKTLGLGSWTLVHPNYAVQIVGRRHLYTSTTCLWNSYALEEGRVTCHSGLFLNRV